MSISCAQSCKTCGSKFEDRIPVDNKDKDSEESVDIFEKIECIDKHR